MQHYSFDPASLSGAQLEWFQKWTRRADRATRRTIQAAQEGGDHSWSERVWKDLKVWLLDNVFRGKCAYCEGRFDPQSAGAADHHRPKGRVQSQKDGRRETLMRGGVAHRGYYWLAYAWLNILPSCDRCNSGTAKGDQFPIRGTRVFFESDVPNPGNIEELDAVEDPLLLHPYRDDPKEHLVFGIEGTIAAREGSERGQVTIDVCSLQRTPLREDRKERQEFARTTLLDALAAAGTSDRSTAEVLAEMLDRFVKETSPYSACIQQTLSAHLIAMGSGMFSYADQIDPRTGG